MTKARKTYHHGDLREGLIAAAIRFLSERSGPFFTMRELASTLGVSHSAAYRHFKDKDALLTAIADQGFRKLGEYQQKRLEGKKNLLSRLKALGMSYVEFALAQPSHFRVMFGPRPINSSAELTEVSGKTFQPVVDEVVSCQNAKKVKAGNPEEIAFYLWAGVHGLSMLLLDRQTFEWGDTDSLIDGMTDVMMDAFVI